MMKTSLNFSFIFHFTLLIFLPCYPTNADENCNADDKAALLKIRDHFGGQNGPLSIWDNSTECCISWGFVGCDDDQSDIGRVTTIDINRFSGLSGTLPPEFGDLPFLTFLSINDEPNLTGPIPPSLGNLKKLETLRLNSNSLSGAIPASLGKMKSLTEMDLGNNRLTGSIPASLRAMPILSQLNVSHNALTGSIPLLPRTLYSVDLSFNQLCGAIPSGLSQFSASMFEHNKCLCGAPLAPCN